MKVKVFRFDPAKNQESYFQNFEVPVSSEEKWTVMDVLDYIVHNLDSSLSYYRHSVCNQGICGRCSLKVNGKAELACVYKVTDTELLLEPKSNNIVKDLVTK